MKLFPLFLFSALVSIVTLSTILEDRTRTDVLSLQESQEQEKLIKATLRVADKIYPVSVPQGSSVSDLMAEAQETSDFRFKGREFPGLGFFVQELNGVAENPRQGTFWIYYINGEKAKVGISAYTVKADDIISWNYEHEE